MRIVALALLLLVTSPAEASWYRECVLRGSVQSEPTGTSPSNDGRSRYAFAFVVQAATPIAGHSAKTECARLEGSEIEVRVHDKWYRSRVKKGSDIIVHSFAYENACEEHYACLSEWYELLSERQARRIVRSQLTMR